MNVVLALACVASAHHDHLFRVGFRSSTNDFTPLPLLGTPAATTHGRQLRRHTHAVERPSFKLTYDAVHSAESLLLLDPTFAPLITSMVCNSTHVQLRPLQPQELFDELTPRCRPNVLVLGACASPGENVTPFYRRMSGLLWEADGTAVIAATEVGLQAAFEELTLSFSWGPQAPASAPTASPRTTAPADAGPRKRRLFLDRVGGKLNDLGETLVDAGGALLEGAGRLIGGAVQGVVDGLPEVVQEVTDRFEESLPAAVRTHWQSLTRRRGGGYVCWCV